MNRPFLLRFRRIYFTIILLSISNLLMAQRTVSGKIISGENQQPVSGATIAVKGSKNQTQTDAGGNFTISASVDDILIVTNVGFKQMEVRAGEASMITLITETKNLSEVVITALGVKKELKRLGYSIQEVKGEDLVKARDANPI